MQKNANIKIIITKFEKQTENNQQFHKNKISNLLHHTTTKQTSKYI
jgi:hypothetical protein